MSILTATPSSLVSWADYYRARGWNVLPMRSDAKRPQVKFAQWWDVPCPADLIDRHPCEGIQIMTGRRWRLLVIDLDGQAGIDWFYSLGPARRVPLTWVTHSGGGGLHLWFRLVANFKTPLPKARLWGQWDATLNDGKGGWTDHTAVERLCDRSLVVAPPSLHPGTDRVYEFRSRVESPKRLAMPALCPGWILGMRPMETPGRPPDRLPWKGPPSLPNHRHDRAGPIERSGRFRTADVVAAIPDKVGLAESWGLRVCSSRANTDGWVPCHAFDREDRHPSASISDTTGRYFDFVTHTKLGFLDLAVALGAYRDWKEAQTDLAHRYHVREAI